MGITYLLCYWLAWIMWWHALASFAHEITWRNDVISRTNTHSHAIILNWCPLFAGYSWRWRCVAKPLGGWIRSSAHMPPRSALSAYKVDLAGMNNRSTPDLWFSKYMNNVIKDAYLSWMFTDSSILINVSFQRGFYERECSAFINNTETHAQ